MKFEFMNFDIGNNEKLLKTSRRTNIEEDISLEEKIFDKFYKYTGIKPGSKITKDDIDEHRLTAFERIGYEEGLTNEGLEKILLK